MRVKYFLVAVALLLGFGVSSLWANELPFKPGETIRYSIKQFGVKAGEAVLRFDGEKEIDGKKVYLIVFKSTAPKFFDEEQIFIDTVSFRPVRVIRDIDIWGKKEKITEDYTPDGKAKVVKVAEGKTTEQLLDRKGPVDNIYGFIYRYRAEGKFSSNEKFDIRLPTLDITMTIGEAVSFNAVGKKYNAAVLRSVPSKYTIWMDTTKQRIPLRISGSVGVATTVMTLIEYKE